MGISPYNSPSKGQIPQGFAAQEPKKYVLDDEEYDRIAKLAQLRIDDIREEQPTKDEEGEKSEKGQEIMYFLINNRG